LLHALCRAPRLPRRRFGAAFLHGVSLRPNHALNPDASPAALARRPLGSG
jgi:hypothetical protein